MITQRVPGLRHLGRALTVWGGAPIATLGYLAAALVLLYPVSLHPLTLLPVHAYDTYQHVWSLWWVRYSLLHGISPAQVTHLYAPSGLYFPLVWTWFVSLARGVLLQPLVGLVGTYNILTIATFPITGLTTYLLAREVTGSRIGAFFAGLVMVFAPMRTIRLVGHFFLLDTSWLALYTLFLWRLLKKPCWKNALGCGISLALIAFSHMLYVAYFALPVTLLLVLYTLATGWRALPKGALLRFGMAAVVIALVIVAPLYAPYLRDHLQDPARFVQEGGNAAFCADLFSFFVPSQFNPLVERLPWLEHYAWSLIPPGGNGAESTTYLGWMAILWSGVGIVAHRRQSCPWLLVAVATAILALGPILRIGGQPVMFGPEGAQSPVSLPYAWLSELPLMSIGRTPGRFSVTTLLAVALLAALGVSRFWASKLPRWGKGGLVGLSALLLVLEYMVWWPLPAFPTPVSPFYQELRVTHAPGEIAVLDFPMFFLRNGHLSAGPNYGMIYQTVHEQRISGGYFTRWPTRERGYAQGLDHMLLPERELDIFAYSASDPVAATLGRMGFTYVVVHRPVTQDSPPDVIAQAWAYSGFMHAADARTAARERLNAMLGRPIYEDAILWAWRVPEAPPTGQGLLMYAGRGWYDPQRAEDLTFRWMQGSEAEIWVELNEPTWAALKLDVSSRAQGVLRFSLNGQPFGEAPISQDWTGVRSLPVYLDGASNRLVLHAELAGDFSVDYNARFAQVSLEPLETSGEPMSASVALEDSLHLVGISPILAENGPPTSLYASLAWRADAVPSDAFKSYIHLVGQDGAIVAQDDPQSAAWGRPATSWAPGEAVWVRYTLDLPSELAPGNYRLYAGLYHPETLRRLDVIASDLPTGEHGVLIGQVDLDASGVR